MRPTLIKGSRLGFVHFDGPFFYHTWPIYDRSHGNFVPSIAVFLSLHAPAAQVSAAPLPAATYSSSARGQWPTRRRLPPDLRRAMNKVLSRHMRAALPFRLISHLLCIV